MLYYYFLIYFILEEIKAFIVFIDENSSGIIFLVFAIYLLLIYRWPYKLYCNNKILKEYKRENNGNDKKYTAKFCEEDCIFDSKDKILNKNTGDNVYLVDEKNYRHIADGYTFRKLGYPSPNKCRKGCFSKKNKELKEEIKIYNIISDINSILKMKP